MLANSSCSWSVPIDPKMAQFWCFGWLFRISTGQVCIKRTCGRLNLSCQAKKNRRRKTWCGGVSSIVWPCLTTIPFTIPGILRNTSKPLTWNKWLGLSRVPGRCHEEVAIATVWKLHQEWQPHGNGYMYMYILYIYIHIIYIYTYYIYIHIIYIYTYYIYIYILLFSNGV